jgi:hypothetical protein
MGFAATQSATNHLMKSRLLDIGMPRFKFFKMDE